MEPLTGVSRVFDFFSEVSSLGFLGVWFVAHQLFFLDDEPTKNGSQNYSIWKLKLDALEIANVNVLFWCVLIVLFLKCSKPLVRVYLRQVSGV